MNFQVVTDKFDELETLSEKYSDYQSCPVSEIVYQDARSPEDEKKARKIAIQFNLFIGLFFVVFGTITVLTFITDTTILVKALLTVITGIIGYVFLKSIFEKPKVTYGRAVYKYRRLVGHVGSRRSAKRYVYIITFIPDNGEKKIYTGVQASQKDYEQIQEGTPIIIVNKGPKACIL
ncbi:MAG: hypothetical protein IKE91_03105 [Clostridia bacterium]|nr:hypothetical protein [Clostridia bacterium]